ncbi:MAG: nitrous oxide reductase accessory protein NosL [Bacteroidota bacterium]
MSTRSRILLALAALLIGLLYVLPIWSIDLEAPQYPEGIGMVIWINDITGAKPHDLGNINGLNHYIGMKEIVPEEVPELKIMPWLFAALIAFGLVAAATGKRWMLYTWVGVFVLVGIAGMADFWLWEYDYGHDLDPTAAIQVPGMSYQPPLIGSKQMLNITAHSWPAAGMIAALVSMLIGLAVAIMEFRQGRRDRSTEAASSESVASGMARSVPAVLAILVLLAGCQPEPRAIRYGEDVGAYCKMTISDARFGTELVTTTGKVYVFNSVECMASYVLAHDELEDQTHSLWVTAYDAPGELIPLDSAFFVRSLEVQSPMSGNLAAFGSGTTPEVARRQLGGEVLAWADVLELGDQLVQRGADHPEAAHASSAHRSDTAMDHSAGH